MGATRYGALFRELLAPLAISVELGSDEGAGRMAAYYQTPILILAMWRSEHCLRRRDAGRRARRWRETNR